MVRVPTMLTVRKRIVLEHPRERGRTWHQWCTRGVGSGSRNCMRVKRMARLVNILHRLTFARGSEALEFVRTLRELSDVGAARRARWHRARARLRRTDRRARCTGGALRRASARSRWRTRWGWSACPHRPARGRRRRASCRRTWRCSSRRRCLTRASRVVCNVRPQKTRRECVGLGLSALPLGSYGTRNSARC